LETLLELLFKKAQLETHKAMPNNSTNVLCSSDQLCISKHPVRKGRNTLPISYKGKLQHRFTHSSPAGSYLVTQPTVLVTEPHKRTKESFWVSPSTCSSTSLLACFSPYKLMGHWLLTQRPNAGKPTVDFQKTSVAWVTPMLITTHQMCSPLDQHIQGVNI